MNILEYKFIYLVGIKGVAMTSLAQCLVDAGKKVQGSDLAEEFVTQPILDRLPIHVDIWFDSPLPPDIDCVVYTAAHQSQQNPQVVAAKQRNLPCFSQAEALASLFNQKQGLAVCGVGGKSTTAAMITWIFSQAAEAWKTPTQSFSVGVGNIPGLEKTGHWNSDLESKFFVAEADEYVIDPTAPSRGEEIQPRFSFLQPFVTVCTNLKFDHPDVYRDFNHTKEVYGKFFSQVRSGGKLVVNADDTELVTLAEKLSSQLSIGLYSFGTSEKASLQLVKFSSGNGETRSVLSDHTNTYELVLKIPGQFNVMNALAAIAACNNVGIPVADSVKFLAGFRSTMRRSEFIGEKNGVKYYDDYAHHPNEVSQVIHAFREWFPTQRLVAAFQSHTFSRTKALYNEFVEAFGEASEVVMIDIFASAREAFDPTITSDLLCRDITKKYPQVKAQNVKTIENLAKFCKEELKPGDVFLTIGAGDIYQVHELI